MSFLWLECDLIGSGNGFKTAEYITTYWSGVYPVNFSQERKNIITIYISIHMHLYIYTQIYRYKI